MPPKKKTVKNAYYFFMEKYKEDRNRKTPNNPISIKDAASLCSPLWQAMSPEEKKVYEDIAKKEKLRIKGMEVKFTTTGLVVSDVERKEREHQEYVRNMKEEIRNMVVELNLTDLLERKFYFIHVNHFCHCDNGDYIPAEVGVACFSLKCGVDDFYHSMVAPGNLPIGYTYKAQKHSTETHGIPIPPSEIGENDFVKLFMDIYGFVKKGSVDEGKPPIVFTLNEFEPCVSIFLEKISNAAGYEAKQFKVYDFVTLFFELRNKAASFSGSEGFPVYCLAETEIETDSFAYTKEICCYWHEGSEAPQYCSLSRARRWGFHIADHCSRDLDVTLIPGRHLPSTDKYWNDTPVETYYVPRHSRKKAASKAVPSGDASSVASSSSFQPLRQPKSMGVAVSQVLSKEDGPPSLDSDAFPPIGRRIGANFNRAS